jgi:hypothetical protein
VRSRQLHAQQPSAILKSSLPRSFKISPVIALFSRTMVCRSLTESGHGRCSTVTTVWAPSGAVCASAPIQVPATTHAIALPLRSTARCAMVATYPATAVTRALGLSFFSQIPTVQPSSISKQGLPSIRVCSVSTALTPARRSAPIQVPATTHATATHNSTIATARIVSFLVVVAATLAPGLNLCNEGLQLARDPTSQMRLMHFQSTKTKLQIFPRRMIVPKYSLV